MTTPNLDQISDDIRQVMEVLRNQPETAQVPLTALGGRAGPAFDIGAEIRKETDRMMAKQRAGYAGAKRLDLLQADLTQAMMDFGQNAVVERVVKARNDAMVKGAAW